MVDLTSTSPLGNWSYFIGAMNAGRTRVSRLSAMANVRVAGVMLRGAIAAHLMGAARGQAPAPLIAVRWCIREVSNVVLFSKSPRRRPRRYHARLDQLSCSRAALPQKLA